MVSGLFFAFLEETRQPVTCSFLGDRNRLKVVAI